MEDRPREEGMKNSGGKQPHSVSCASLVFSRDFEMSIAGPERLNILVVDDEPIIADTLAKILNLNGFEAVVAYNGPEAIAWAGSKRFDVLLTDVIMPGMNGIETSEVICRMCPQCKVILVSGNVATHQLLLDANECGTEFEIFAKPVHPLAIIERLRGIAEEFTTKSD